MIIEEREKKIACEHKCGLKMTKVQQRWNCSLFLMSMRRLHFPVARGNWTEKRRITKNGDENHFQFNWESRQGFAAGNRGSSGMLSWLWATAEGYFPILGQHTAVIFYFHKKKKNRCTHRLLSLNCVELVAAKAQEIV